MKTFVVTGYSGKMEGFLIVVDAENEVAAASKMVRPDTEHLVKTKAKFFDGSVDAERMFIASKTTTMEDIERDIQTDDAPLRYWEVFVQELVKDVDLDKARCW